MGFDLAESCGIQPLETFEAVLSSARFEFAEAGDFGVVRGDNDFSANFIGDSVFAAEIGHEPNPAHGEAGFKGAGFVVEPAMEHTAVVGALVATRAIFFFKNANRRARLAEQQLAGDCQSHDAAADDEMVVFFQTVETRSHSGSTRAS